MNSKVFFFGSFCVIIYFHHNSNKCNEKDNKKYNFKNIKTSDRTSLRNDLMSTYDKLYKHSYILPILHTYVSVP